MNRRGFLIRSALGAATLGVAKTLQNTVVGYGHFGAGTNLRSQDLDAVARRDMPRLSWREITIADVPVRVMDSAVRYRRNGRWTAVDRNGPRDARELARDVDALRSDAFAFRFSGVDTFFDSLARDIVRPATVEALRGRPGEDPDLVATVTGVQPTEPEALVGALVDVFREQTRYDVPRYLAGSIDDNLLPVDADLRDPFVPEVDFVRLAETDGTIGMFCTEYTRLATEAFHSVAAEEQTVPVFGVRVRDRRHKHVFNGMGSVIREDGELILPMTFADYTDTTLIDDFRARRLLGDSPDAYDQRHRADQIRW